MIYSAAEIRQRARVEYEAEHRFDYLTGKTLTWTEVGEGYEASYSSTIRKGNPITGEYIVDDDGQPWRVEAGQYVKNIQVQFESPACK